MAVLGTTMTATWISITLATIGLGASMNTHAVQQRGNPEAKVDRIFERLDANKDDYIDRGEAEGSRLARRFDRIDANGDDLVSRDELLTAMKERRGRGGGRRRG